MKKILALILVLVLLGGCAATYDGPTTTKPMLTEHTLVQYYSFSDGTTNTCINRTVYAYDIYGNRVRALDYREGELVQETRTTYDENGNELTRTVIDHTGWIPLVEYRNKQTYDEQGRVLSYCSYNMWGRKEGETVYRYDDEANTMTWSDGSGYEVTYYYDENGLQHRDVSSDGSETVYSYDDRGNLTGWTSTRDGKLHSSYEAGYDEQNRLIWSTRYDENEARELKTTYTYDDEARTMVCEMNDGDRRVEYYHADGRIHMVEYYSPEGDVSLIQQYTYRDIRVPAEGEE